jgi:hypothetical protein
MRAFLFGTAIALALIAAAVTSVRPAHASAPVSVTAAAPQAQASGSAESTLQAAVRPGADASVDEAGWVQYATFGVALIVLLVIGTGLVPRRRS